MLDSSICHTKRFPHRLEILKDTKIGHTIGHKIGHKIGHSFPGIRSKMNDLGVTQPDFLHYKNCFFSVINT